MGTEPTARDKAAAVLAAFTGDVWCPGCGKYKDKTDVTCAIWTLEIGHRDKVCHECFNAHCVQLTKERHAAERRRAMESQSYRVAMQEKRTREAREKAQARQAKRRRERGRHQ